MTSGTVGSRIRLAAAGLVAAALAAPAAAHDYWLELASFRPVAGSRVAVHHRVGERLVGEAVPRNPFAIERFVALDAAGEATEVRGADGLDPYGVAPAGPAPGSLRVAFESTPAFVELAPEKFLEYLRLEGLESVIEERRRGGESDRPAREAFSRSAVAWACVSGEASPANSAPEKTAPSKAAPARAVLSKTAPPKTASVPPTPAGLTLEIVPELDLCGVRAGDEAAFRVLIRGRPAGGVLVASLHEPGAAPAAAVRSDMHGVVRLRFPAPGFWLVKAVTMERAADLPNADWRSRWASLAFVVDPAR